MTRSPYILCPACHGTSIVWTAEAEPDLCLRCVRRAEAEYRANLLPKGVAA